MTARTTIPKRRSKPRRGRVVDLSFLSWMQGQECLIATCKTRSEHGLRQFGEFLTVHHVREYGSPKNDRRTLRLCQAHHLHDFGSESIERLGKAEFESRHGVDIEAAISAYNKRYAEETGR